VGGKQIGRHSLLEARTQTWRTKICRKCILGLQPTVTQNYLPIFLPEQSQVNIEFAKIAAPSAYQQRVNNALAQSTTLPHYNPPQTINPFK
jgi:hypothetical protein